MAYQDHSVGAISGASKILPTVNSAGARSTRREIAQSRGLGKRTVSLYDLPVSAGVGVFLDSAGTDEIVIPDNERTKDADFALRISGNSMEPKYHDGDVLLVANSDSVEVGELGIFVLDGNGYFKIYGGDRLVSMNSTYGDILLRDFENISCVGRVVGKVKRK
jgi:phage repressor protein C with HTH and peptisase S24 domain